MILILLRHSFSSSFSCLSFSFIAFIIMCMQDWIYYRVLDFGIFYGFGNYGFWNVW